ncbi:MAG: alkaline phosphatase D family protein [Planctomycetota bacterium]
MKHTQTSLAAGLALSLTASASAQVHLLDPDATIDTITFGSCARQDTEQPVLDDIAAERSDVFLFIGDNVYCDLNRIVPESYDDMKRAWDALAVKPRWQRFTKAQPVLATWDDHDFGLNDAGREWLDTQPGSHAQELFLDFFGERADSPRRDEPGIWDATIVGPEGRRVQLIITDTRSFRDPLMENPEGRPQGKGPYVPHESEGSTLLGEAQWQWLEKQLAKPADVRILATSIQLVADEHGWETWGNFPHERYRLYQMIDDADASGVIVISGDRHLMEISKDTRANAPYPIYDFTSSGLNWDDKPRPVGEPNASRIGDPVRVVNYGVIEIDWNDADPMQTAISLIGKSNEGRVLMQHDFTLGDIQDRD